MKGLNETERWQLIRENRAIIGSIDWDFVVTLNTREKNGTNRTHKIWEFERRLNQALIGRHWRKDTTKGIRWIHNLEDTKQSHSHSVCKCDGFEVSEQAFRTQARRIWAQINRQQTKAQVHINTVTNLDAVAQYITKDGVMDCTPI